MADGERVLLHRELLLEDPPIDLVRLLRLGEALREIPADDLVAGDPRGLDRGRVGIGDLALSADRDQRVPARLDHRPAGLKSLPSLSHVPGDRGCSDD